LRSRKDLKAYDGIGELQFVKGNENTEKRRKKIWKGKEFEERGGNNMDITRPGGYSPAGGRPLCRRGSSGRGRKVRKGVAAGGKKKLEAGPRPGAQQEDCNRRKEKT